MSKGTKIFAVVALAAAVILLVYGFGDSRGYRAGRKVGERKGAVETQEAKEQTIAAQAAAQAAAASEFKAENLLEGVELNPLSKAQKSLNPFE